MRENLNSLGERFGLERRFHTARDRSARQSHCTSRRDLGGGALLKSHCLRFCLLPVYFSCSPPEPVTRLIGHWSHALELKIWFLQLQCCPAECWAPTRPQSIYWVVVLLAKNVHELSWQDSLPNIICTVSFFFMLLAFPTTETCSRGSLHSAMPSSTFHVAFTSACPCSLPFHPNLRNCE